MMDDGTANTEYCDCDKIEKCRFWYIPVAIGIILISFCVGYITGVMK